MAEQPQSLAAALAELQQHLPRIGKDSAAVMPGKNGGRPWGYKYADLATISAALLPLLGKHGLSWTCLPTMADEGFRLQYLLQHAPSRESLEGFYPLPMTGSPQQIGSAITYARRYCLLAVTGAAPDEDDDAQEAEQAARAQRNMPPEVRADGSATDAELTRMSRGHEPGVERLGTTPVDDEFYDAPIVANMDGWPPEDKHGSSLPSQRQDIYIAMSKRGIHTPDARREAIERLIRRTVEAAKDMSFNEAVSVLARVRSWDGRTEELLSPLVAERSQADA